MKIKAGYGYFDTTQYRIGGSFHRSILGKEIEITKILRDTLDGYYGCTHEAEITELFKGQPRTVAFNIADTE
jgi:hypothetical protein